VKEKITFRAAWVWSLSSVMVSNIVLHQAKSLEEDIQGAEIKRA
jgi:hypothetical protein